MEGFAGMDCGLQLLAIKGDFGLGKASEFHAAWTTDCPYLSFVFQGGTKAEGY